jgi:hypothetical protein
VQPGGREGIVFTKSVVDKYGQAKSVSEQNCSVDHGIVEAAQRLLQPAKHVTARSAYICGIEGANSLRFVPRQEGGG